MHYGIFITKGMKFKSEIVCFGCCTIPEFRLKIKMPHGKNSHSKTMILTNKHKLFARLFEEDFWVSQ
jgi:hypothetical protein